MKTTVEIPDDLFRKAKSSAAIKGQSMKRFLTDAISEKLDSEGGSGGEKPWMRHFGALARRHALPVLSNDLHFDFVRKLRRIGW